ncbi:hypothetical protein OG474_18230 [Kribbella sp. NBC_01505]|uniref:hypothetical protein n=1 Tax=Kribbella sp. NBC_01505 TaxID=2903580 RepID=UPI0038653A96
MAITLTVNGEGVAQLRCGEELTPATPQAWTELTATALLRPPTPQRPALKTPAPKPQVTPGRVRRPYRLLGLALKIRTVFSLSFWLDILLFALAVTIAVTIVVIISTALAKS